MTLNNTTLKINSDEEYLDGSGQFDWGKVYGTPVANITSNSHTHWDRYYSKNDVDLRVSSLEKSLNSLQEKIDDKFK